MHEHEHRHQRFDDAAATWDDDPGHEERQVAVARAIREAVDLGPRMRAVDVGGGTGRLSILLADAVGSVVVTDPSSGMVEVAQARIAEAGLEDRLTAVRADLTADHLDGTYDVVWSSMALHHVPDLPTLLRAVADLLVDGGRIAVADLDEDPDGAFHADKVDFDGHHGFDRRQLTDELTRAGFADVAFVDATTILKEDREFGVFLCTATKRPPASGSDGGSSRGTTREPVPFEVYEQGVYLHGTKAELAVGDMLVPGRESNFEEGRVMNYVYFTATLDAATWGAELAAGEGRARIYVVEPTGDFGADPNVTDKRFPGNPTQSFRSREPIRVVAELADWVGHPPEKVQAMRDGLAALQQQGGAQIED